MPLFFDNLESLHRFTLELDRHQEEIRCPHCHLDDQFVSHGFVYKKQAQADPAPVAKRIFCSNRYGKTGCGRTRQLYLSEVVPRLSYSALQVFVFLSSLIAGLPISEAYQQAVKKPDFRHAYRWLKKLMARLSAFRSLFSRPVAAPTFLQRSQRLQLLLPTLKNLFTFPNSGSCQAFQLTSQSAFF